MDFDSIGKMAIGSRLRSLSNSMMKDATHIYALYGVDLKPKWFTVFYLLSQQEEGKAVTHIANEIGHSHPSVVKIIKEMASSGLVSEHKDKTDGRVNIIELTPKGKQLVTKIQNQYVDVENAVAAMQADTNHDLWKALQEFEYLLDQKSILKRVKEQKRIRENQAVQIVDYNHDYRVPFRELNEEWISKYFTLEDADTRVLNEPQKNILDPGGHIIIALDGDNVIGVCALLKMKDEKYDYELAKMAVSPIAQGRGIGYLLGKSIIDKAKSLGSSAVYIESNTALTPAISLYHKLGFKKVVGRDTPYERCNIQMELIFD